MIAVISKPIQVSFSDKIEREFCEGSAIAPSLYRANIEIIEDRGLWEPNLALGQKVSRFWETARPHSFGAIAMFRQESDEYWQGKPENPRTHQEKSQKALKLKLGREIEKSEVFALVKKHPDCNVPIKYESGVGNGSRAFLPAIDQSTRKAIARRYGVAVPLEGSFWDWLEQHPEIPIIVTEGGKKGLALLSLGYVAIAFYGVHGGYRVNDRASGEAIPLEKPELIADISRLAVPGRPIIVGFDQDSNLETIKTVQGAIFKFGGLLKTAGCNVSIASWEPSQGKGIDDLIVNRGAAVAETAIAKAKPFKAKLKLAGVAHTATPLPKYELSYPANISVKTRYLGNLVIPNDAKLIALKAPKGSGKTEFMAQIAQQKEDRVLVITHREQLGRQISSRFGISYLADANKKESEGDRQLGMCLCIDSLHPNSAAHFDYSEWANKDVFVDEILSVLWHLLDSSTCSKNRISILQQFQGLIRAVLSSESSGRLIVADADLDDTVIKFILDSAGQPDLKPFIVSSEYKADKGWDVYHYQEHADLYSKLCEAIASGGKHFIACTGQKVSSKWGSQILEQQLKQAFPHKKIIRVDRESVVEPGHPAFGCIETLDETIADYDIAIATPTIETGISIDLRNHFQGMWIFASGVVPESSVRQFAARVRDPKVPRHVSAPARGCNFAFVGGGEVSPRDLLLGQRKVAKINLRELKDAAIAIDTDGSSSYNGAALDAYGKLGARVNQGLHRYWPSIRAAWQAEGHAIIEADELDKDARTAISKALGATRDGAHQSEAEAIANTAPPESLDAYEELHDQKIKTPEERRSQRVWEIQQKYMTENVSPELVLKDDDGWHGLISMQYYLTVGAEFLQQRDCAKFEAIAPSKLDWWVPDINKKLLSAKVLALRTLGFADLLAAVQGGEELHSHHDLVSSFVEGLRGVSEEELKLFTGLSGLEDQPMAVVQGCFDRLLGFRLLKDGQRTLVHEGETTRLNLYVWPSERAIARLEHLGKAPKEHPQDGRNEIFEAWLKRDFEKAGKPQPESIPELKRSDSELNSKRHIDLNKPSAVQPPHDLGMWAAPENFSDIREWLSQAPQCPDAQEMLKLVPPEVLRLAIAQTAKEAHPEPPRAITSQEGFTVGDRAA